MSSVPFPKSQPDGRLFLSGWKDNTLVLEQPIAADAVRLLVTHGSLGRETSWPWRNKSLTF